MDIESKVLQARENFMKGYNCAQAVAMSFAPELGLPEAQVALLASGFGGGMGRLREVCGAMSGAVLVYSGVKGYSDPENPEEKKRTYARIQRIGAGFKERFGSCICREILAGLAAAKSTSPAAESRTAQFYAERPCLRCVETAARLAAQLLSEEA